MDGIEKITAKIAADAQAEADALLVQAREEAQAITNRAKAKADAIAAELGEKGRRAAAEREERMASVAQLDARKVQLAAKQELLDKAFDCALANLCATESGELTALLAGLLVKASRTGKEKVAFNVADRARVGKDAVLLANEKGGLSLTLAEETRSIKGGFILVDGKVETNCAFETLVRLQRESMAGEVAKLLFG